MESLRKAKIYFEKGESGKLDMKKICDGLIKLIGYSLIVYAVVCSIAFYVFKNQGYFYIWRTKHLSNHLGNWAEYAGIAAVSLWIARKVFIEVKKRKIPDFQLPRHALLFMRRHHVLLGWVTFAATTAHGLYYLARQSGNDYMLWTGWSAWGALLLLTGLGVWFDYKLEAKKGKVKGVRLLHAGISVLFLIGIYLHLYY